MGKKKKVIYLVGAGATHSEVSLYDNTINMLTKSIAEGIRQKITQKKLSGLSEVVNDLTSDNIDIEQLITLYETSGFSNSQKIARHLRQAFMNEIQERLDKLPNDYKPVLFSALIDMYDTEGFDEELQGFLTLNYAVSNKRHSVSLRYYSRWQSAMGQREGIAGHSRSPQRTREGQAGVGLGQKPGD